MMTNEIFFEGYLSVQRGNCPDTAPPGFSAFGTIRWASDKKWTTKRIPLFISEDGQRLIAGTAELTDYDLVFARIACGWLRNRGAACENSPRQRSNSREHRTPQLITANSLGGSFS